MQLNQSKFLQNCIYLLKNLILICFLIPVSSFASAASSNPVVIFSTPRGSFQAELFQDNQPELVDLFLNYVQAGFYDHLIFHRIVEGFILQGGAYNLNFENKQIALEHEKSFSVHPLKNSYGSIALILNDTHSLSLSPQFFINLSNNNQLNQPQNKQEFMVIGKVTSGMDVVEKIAHSKVGQREGIYNTPFYPKEALVESIKLQTNSGS